MKLTKQFGIEGDGWDVDDLCETLETLEFASEIKYEIESGRRGILAVSGDTTKDLLTDLNELKDRLENSIATIERETK